MFFELNLESKINPKILISLTVGIFMLLKEKVILHLSKDNLAPDVSDQLDILLSISVKVNLTLFRSSCFENIRMSSAYIQ